MQALLQRIETTSDGTKKESFDATFLKKIPTYDFLKIQCQNSTLWDRVHFNKINRGKFQKLDMQLGHRVGLLDDYC